MKFIKDFKYNEKFVSAISNFLILKKDEWFKNEENHAVSEEDFIRFNILTDQNHLIRYGEYCLVDIYCGQMWICKHQKRKTKLNDGRVTTFMPVCCVISDCRRDLGNCWNGYFMIPNMKYNPIYKWWYLEQ